MQHTVHQHMYVTPSTRIALRKPVMGWMCVFEASTWHVPPAPCMASQPATYRTLSDSMMLKAIFVAAWCYFLMD